ncbi:MAG: ester cyclase [Haliea sp.]
MTTKGPRIAGERPVQPHHSRQQKAKAERVLDFLQHYVIEHDPSVGERFFGESYTQHNPMIADGQEGVKRFAEQLREQFPELEIDIKRVFVDGDYVIVHHHARWGTPSAHDTVFAPATKSSAVIDIFRLEGDRIVEHWDVMQDVLEVSANENTMF